MAVSAVRRLAFFYNEPMGITESCDEHRRDACATFKSQNASCFWYEKPNNAERALALRAFLLRQMDSRRLKGDFLCEPVVGLRLHFHLGEMRVENLGGISSCRDIGF